MSFHYQYFFNPRLSALNLLFDQPRRIIFGPDSSKQCGFEAKRLGGKRSLLVTDINVEKSGLLNPIIESVERQEIKLEVYNKVAFEPTIESIRNAVEWARNTAPYDVIIGVGGGSVLDTAKMISNMLTNQGDPLEYLNPLEDKFKNPSLPKILIPTTAGTGSEVSNYAVVIEKESMFKTFAASSNLFAEVALVDPKLTLTCPPRVTASSLLDALGHNLEGLISKQSTPISDGLAIEATKLLLNFGLKAYNSPDDIEARSGTSMGALLGGMVIAYPWVGGPAILGHCLAEAFGPKFNIPHGMAVGISLPYILNFNLPACIEKMYFISQSIGLKEDGSSLKSLAKKLPYFILQLLSELEMPTRLKDINFPKSYLEPFAQYIVRERQHLYNLSKYNPRKLNEENVINLLNDMYEGVLE
jgi:Alcohol dehydrogenase, class IV